MTINNKPGQRRGHSRCTNTHLWSFSKSKFNLKSDRVNLVAPASSIECLIYLPYIRAVQYKLGPERLTRLGNSNVPRLPVRSKVLGPLRWDYKINILHYLEKNKIKKKKNIKVFCFVLMLVDFTLLVDKLFSNK